MTVLPLPTNVRPVPDLGRPRRLRQPTAAERTLPNGLRVVAVRRPTVPVVQVRLRVPAAVRRPADHARSRLQQRTLLMGTHDRSDTDIAEALQRVGGGLRVGGDADSLQVSGEALRTGLPGLLELLAEVVTGAAYPRAAVEGEQGRLADQTRRAMSRPGTLADETWLRRMYGEHPYGQGLPDPDEVLAVTPAALRALHRRGVRPDGALLVLVGDLSPQRVLDRVADTLGAWSGDGGATAVPKVPAVSTGPVGLAHRAGAVQSNLRIGGPALTRDDPAYPALDLARTVFGGYFSSRLVQNIREDKGYTYSPHCTVRHAAAKSDLLLQVDVATEVTAPAMVEIGYELGRIASLPPTEEELRSAANYLGGTIALATSGQAGLASVLTELLAAGLGLDWLRDHPLRLLDVTPEQVHEQAARLLAPSALVTTVVGDADAVLGPLAALGPVELTDAAIQVTPG